MVVGARSGFQRGLDETSSVNSTKSLAGGITLGFVSAVVFLPFRTSDLRVDDDLVAADAAEILDRLVAALLHELLHAVDQVLDHRLADRAIEHRRGADLHRAA